MPNTLLLASPGFSDHPPPALLISIQPGFQANVCKKTSCFFPSPWHLCAWNNDRDFSSDAICCWVRHCFYIYRQMPCGGVNTVDLQMSRFWTNLDLGSSQKVCFYQFFDVAVVVVVEPFAYFALLLFLEQLLLDPRVCCCKMIK